MLQLYEPLCTPREEWTNENYNDTADTTICATNGKSLKAGKLSNSPLTISQPQIRYQTSKLHMSFFLTPFHTKSPSPPSTPTLLHHRPFKCPLCQNFPHAFRYAASCSDKLQRSFDGRRGSGAILQDQIPLTAGAAPAGRHGRDLPSSRWCCVDPKRSSRSAKSGNPGHARWKGSPRSVNADW